MFEGVNGQNRSQNHQFRREDQAMLRNPAINEGSSRPSSFGRCGLTVLTVVPVFPFLPFCVLKRFSVTADGGAKRIVRFFWGGGGNVLQSAPKTSFGGLRRWDSGLYPFPLKENDTAWNKRGGGGNVS